MGLRDVVLDRVKGLKKNYEPNRQIVQAVTAGVDADDTCAVDGRPGYIWVVEQGSSAGAFQVFNSRVRTAVGIPLLIASASKPPYRRTIVEIDWDTIVNLVNQSVYEGTAGFIDTFTPNHAVTHEWPNGSPGGDALHVYERAIVPLKLSPNTATGYIVDVQPGFYTWHGAVSLYAGASLDLSQYVPASGKQLRVLVYLDPSTATITALATAEYSTSAVLPYPSVTSRYIPLAFVKLLNTTTNITESLIEDARAFAHATPVNTYIVKSYSGTTQGLGASPDIYLGGYYEAPAADANLSQASTTQTYGTANLSKAAHAFIVASGAGSVDTGVVGLRVTGISINDLGVRTASDTEVLSADITALTADEYIESSKKWLGQVTFELYTVSGSPTTYSADFNYGFAKYEDFNNLDFKIRGVEAIGFAGANDSDFDVELLVHDGQDWTYDASAFVPGGTVLCSLAGDHSTDDQLAASEHFAWKRSNLNRYIEGSASEGIVIRVSSSANNAVEYVNANLTVDLNP